MLRYPNATKIATERQTEIKEDLKDLIRANGKRETILKLLRTFELCRIEGIEREFINGKIYSMFEMQFIFSLLS